MKPARRRAFLGLGSNLGDRLSHLRAAVAARQNTFHRNSNLGTGSGYSNGTGYVMGKGWSVIYDD